MTDLESLQYLIDRLEKHRVCSDSLIGDLNRRLEDKVRLTKFADKANSQLAVEVKWLKASNEKMRKQINEAVDHLYSEDDDSGYNALCALGAD